MNHRQTLNARLTSPISRAFFADAPVRIRYRDADGEATERVVHIKELHSGHLIARCLLREGEFRRFNLERIERAAVVRRSLIERISDYTRKRLDARSLHHAV